MHNLGSKRVARRVRRPLSMVVGLLLALLLAGCGVTDEVGTNFRIALTPVIEDEDSLAAIGALRVDEMAHVRFEVKPRDGEPVDRTEQAVFELVNKAAKDNAEDFLFVYSPDPATTPHTIRGTVVDSQVTLCATYDGWEVQGEEPVEVCMTVLTFEPDV